MNNADACFVAPKGAEPVHNLDSKPNDNIVKLAAQTGVVLNSVATMIRDQGLPFDGLSTTQAHWLAVVGNALTRGNVTSTYESDISPFAEIGIKLSDLALRDLVKLGNVILRSRGELSLEQCMLKI